MGMQQTPFIHCTIKTINEMEFNPKKEKRVQQQENHEVNSDSLE